MALPPPLIPTRTPTPTQPKSHTSSTSAPTTSTRSSFPSHAFDPHATISQPTLAPSSPSSSDFGAFVSSDPLHASRLDPQRQPSMDPWDFAAAGTDFLEEARTRDERRREGLLGNLDVGTDGLGGLSLLESKTEGEGRKIPGGHVRKSSFGTMGRLSMSPPRRLSHVMSMSPPKSTDYMHQPPFHQIDEPTPLVSPSNAELFHPLLEKRANSQDFFSPLVRKQSLDTSRPNPTFSDLSPTEPSTFKKRAPKPTGPTEKSTLSSSSSGPNGQNPVSLLPNLIKQTSKWKSILTSSPSSGPLQPSSSSPSFQTNHITHSTPFHIQSAGPYVPPTGAPGFTPHSNLLPQGGFSTTANGGLENARGILLKNRREETIPILTEDGAECLRPHLPPRLRLAGSWSLVYSLDQHGSSLGTLYANSGKFEEARRRKDGSGAAVGNVLLLRTALGEVFGGFIGEGFKKNIGYFGSGDCFLFKFHPFPNTTVGEVSRLGGLEVFKWTGKNQYMCLCEAGFLSIGGGDGKYGLYLDSQMYNGISQKCPAFDNEVLVSDRDGKFECIGVEVWGVGD